MINGLIGGAIATASDRERFIQGAANRFPSLVSHESAPYAVMVSADEADSFLRSSGHSYKAIWLGESEAMTELRGVPTVVLVDSSFFRAWAIETIVQVEGDKSFHDHGPQGGGVHKWGVSEKYFPEVKKPSFSRDDAERIFDMKFIRDTRIMDMMQRGMPLEVAIMHISASVLSPRNAGLAYQTAFNLTNESWALEVDGHIGAKSVNAVTDLALNSESWALYTMYYHAAYISALARGVITTPARRKWLEGWSNRIQTHTTREMYAALEVMSAKVESRLG